MTETPPDERSTNDRSPERTTGDIRVESVANLDALIDQFVESRPEQLRPETLSQYSIVLKHFKDWCIYQAGGNGTDHTDELEFPIDLETASACYIERQAAELSDASSQAHTQRLNTFSQWARTHNSRNPSS